VIRQKLKELDEEAGLVALDNSGNLTILSNAPLLCWGYVDLAGQQVFGIEK
jgi:isoaspartyl peptidase/L-asparaginase-like protein (Ntn-hydrolase superfamily)